MLKTGSIDGAIQGAVASGFMYGAGSVAEALLAQEVAAAGERFAPGSGAREAAAQAARSSSVWASGGIGRAGLHAVVGCVQHVGGGGKCGQGALSAGFAEVAGPMLPGEDGSTTRLAGHLVVGGVGSVLGGGKFKNGAITGAFGYLFNECAHTRACGREGGYDSSDPGRAGFADIREGLRAGLDEYGCLQIGTGGGICFGPGAIRGLASNVLTQMHHAWPQYLGGPAKQQLVELSQELHAQYHAGLDKLLPRQWGAEYYRGLTSEVRAGVFARFEAYTRAFDARFGTDLWDTALKNGFPGGR